MIDIEHDPGTAALAARGVFDRPVWQQAVSRFDWHYDAAGACYLLEGEVAETPAGGAPVTIRAGDRVTFAAGLDCVRDIHVPMRKHSGFDVQRRLDEYYITTSILMKKCFSICAGRSVSRWQAGRIRSMMRSTGRHRRPRTDRYGP